MCIITSALTIGGLSISAAVANAALAVGTVATAVSTTMGVVGSVQQGKAQQAQYNYQAEVARNNAKIAQANADQQRQEGIEESRLQRLRTLQAIGSQQAAMAANGIDISSGTALDIVEDTSAMGELDALTTRYNSETQALAYEQQANNFTNQANLDVFAGENAYSSGITNAISTGVNGLGNAASVAGKWYTGNSIGNNKRVSGTKVSGGIAGDLITFA